MSHLGAWCEACDAALPRLVGPHCPVCARLTPDGAVCGSCLKNPPAYSDTVAAFAYSFPVDRLIQAMKYDEQIFLAAMMAKKLASLIDRSNLPDCLLAMPLHPARLKSRGFNQAQLIAKPLSKSLGIPLLNQACRRLRDTPSQTSLPYDARTRNMKDAFGCDADFSGKHVALIDDVMTSGASMNALAKAALAKGATRISAWVVARTA